MSNTSVAALLSAALLAACQGEIANPSAFEAELGPRLGLAQVESQGIAGAASGSAHVSVDLGVPLPPGLGLRNFAFTALRDAEGNVRGAWQIVAGSSILHGNIDCLTIEPGGASARVSGLVTQAKFTTFLPGTAFAMEIFDNGNGGSGDPDVSTQLRAFRNAAPEVGRQFCISGTIPDGADLQPLPTDHGNFSIRVP
jgi:hypothetical protein